MAVALACEDCIAESEFPGWKRFNALACIYCAARLIKRIAHYAKGEQEITTRRQAALAASVERGLSETEIRALVKNGPLVQPKAPKEKKK